MSASGARSAIRSGRRSSSTKRSIRLLLVAVLAGGHVLIEDVPGVGKTLLARAFSRALGLDFSRVQGTPDLLPSDILGASVLEGGTFRFIPGPIFTNVLLVDEINRATPRSQSALLEAMEEGHVSIEGDDARPAGPVPRAGDREPDRAGGHVRAAGGTAGPFPRPDPAWLPRVAPMRAASRGAIGTAPSRWTP